jgi:tetratricopeptide (TPR) repeat protein/transcriptional regulator with XRE-family HTH domain
VAEPGLSFAGLLRQLRAEAKLTQEELAEAAGLSPRSVSDLERGITRTAHKDTALLLAGALGLAEPTRALFVLAARGRGSAADVLAARQGQAPGAFAAAATRALPRDIAAFTGRQAELAQLMGALATSAAGGGVVGICAVDGMAGIGKTAFAVHAAHRLAGAFPDGQFFLPLHAYTAGQRPVDPADALASLLLTAGVPAAAIPPGLEARAGQWRDQVAGKKVLLLLDDAAGHEQVAPLLPGTSGSLVLVTSRRRLTALQDAAVISLDTLPAEEAGTLLTRLAARPGLPAGDAAVGEITRLCGYLPLAIGMLASQLRHHPAWSAADVAASLDEARDRLGLMHAENVSVAAAFGLSYADLSTGSQRLFRRLGLVPGPSLDGYAAAALDGTSLDEARRRLDQLYDQHLITEPAPGRYQLHDLLREHAQILAAADDPAESDAATSRLLDYYLNAAVVAARHIATRAGPASDWLLPGRPPAHAPGLSAHGQAAAWLEAERPNLHAAASYAADSGRAMHAIWIPAAVAGFLHTHGHFDQATVLHQTALTAARQAADRAGQAAALRQLGIVRMLTGKYRAAAASLHQALAIFQDIEDRAGQAHCINNLGCVQRAAGEYAAAAASQQQALAIFRDAGDRLGQANALNDLGLTRQLTGDYPAAAASYQQALALYRDAGNPFGQADTLSNLGEMQQLTGDYAAAAASQQQALAIFRDIGHRFGQGWALNGLGAVQQQAGDYTAAAASHQQALAIFRDLGFRLDQAETLNNLGELSSRTSATGQAREHHTAALEIARGISAPLEEARALEGLGQVCLVDGDTGQAAIHLRKALGIYQRIGAPGAGRVQETLQDHGLTPIQRHTGQRPPPQRSADPSNLTRGHRE